MKLLRTEKDIEFRLFLFRAVRRANRSEIGMGRNAEKCTALPCRAGQTKKINLMLLLCFCPCARRIIYFMRFSVCKYVVIVVIFFSFLFGSSAFAGRWCGALVHLLRCDGRPRLCPFALALFLLIILLFLTDGCAFCPRRAKHKAEKHKKKKEKNMHPICIIYASERKAVLFLVWPLHTYSSRSSFFSSSSYATYALATTCRMFFYGS